MSGLYKRLLMGQGKKYYEEILTEIYIKFGNKSFKWSEVGNEKITQSVLSRLKFSNYIQKDNTKFSSVYKDHKKVIPTTMRWKLHPDVKNYLKEKKFI